MKNILIPTDFSPNAWNALKYALGFFKGVHCNFYLLHVAPLSEYPVMGHSFTPSLGETGMPSKNKLDAFTERAKNKAESKLHHFFPELHYGLLIDVTRRLVKEKKIDLIVMGTKGASGIKRLIIGSNTGDIITKVQCNTLVVPEHVVYGRPRMITFPTDYNIFYSHAILETLSELVIANKAHLKVLHVVGSNENLSEDQQNNRAYLQDYLEEIFPKQHGFHLIDNRKITQGIQEFISEKQSDLTIMVAKNLNFLQQLLFDSTVEKVSFHTQVPFLVIHG
ncbi:universal stress protein [Flavobacteriaceae bacterium 3-367]